MLIMEVDSHSLMAGEVLPVIQTDNTLIMEMGSPSPTAAVVW